MASYDSLWAMPIALGLMGFGGGMSRTTLTAIWAEVFGVASLGTIRSAAIMFMVVMSGLSPFVLGLAFDAGLGVSTTLWSMTIVGVIFLVPAMTTTRTIRSRQQANKN